MSDARTRILAAALSGLLAAAMILAAVAAAGSFACKVAPRVPPAVPGGDFSLRSAAGVFHLHDLRGKVALVYFGYTHCPDACPMALGVMAAAMRALPPAWSEKVAGVFVSLDPERDAPAMLRDYARFFDPRIVGVTGDAARLREVARAWRVDWHVPAHAAGEDYAVDHSTFIYLVTPDGRVADVFDEKTEPARLALAVKRWILAGGSGG